MTTTPISEEANDDDHVTSDQVTTKTCPNSAKNYRHMKTGFRLSRTSRHLDQCTLIWIQYKMDTDVLIGDCMSHVVYSEIWLLLYACFCYQDNI